MDAITIQDVYKTYATGKEALKGVTFSVKEREFTALLGVNGAGKTTIIGILTGLIRKTSGYAAIFGSDLDKNPALARRMVGVVPQELNFNLFGCVTNVLLNQAGYFGVSRRLALAEVERLLHQLHLWEQRNHEVRTLSGGMRRRLMLARALVHRPRLLLLDEPTTGIDVHLRDQTWRFLKELNHSGTTILLTTHYLEEVEQLCRRAAFISEGSIVCVDSVEKIAGRLEKQVFMMHLNSTAGLDRIKGFELRVVSEMQAEVELNSHQTVTDLVEALKEEGKIVYTMRPKRNRLEQLFLKLNNPETKNGL